MQCLTHWGRVTHIRVGKLTNIGSDNGLSPGRHQAIIWTNVGKVLIGPLGTNFGEILIRIETFSFRKKHLKISSAKWRPFCLGLNVLMLKPVNCYGIWLTKTGRHMYVTTYNHGFGRQFVTYSEQFFWPIWSHINKFTPSDIWYKFTNILATNCLWSYCIWIWKLENIYTSFNFAVNQATKTCLQYFHHSRHPFILGCCQQMRWDY